MPVVPERVLLITVVFAGVVTVPAAAQTGTMQFRYNAQHTGDYSAVAGSVQPNNQLKWSNTTGGDGPSPTVVDGVVYVGGRQDVYAFNATNGAKVWNYTTGGAVDTSPAVANGVVYVGSYDGNSTPSTPTTGANSGTTRPDPHTSKLGGHRSRHRQ